MIRTDFDVYKTIITNSVIVHLLNEVHVFMDNENKSKNKRKKHCEGVRTFGKGQNSLKALVEKTTLFQKIAKIHLKPFKHFVVYVNSQLLTQRCTTF